MDIIRRACLKLVVVAGLAVAAPVTYAATYSFTIEGTVFAGNEFFANAYNLTAGDIITATGMFTADLGTIGLETGIVSFGNGSGNSLSIDLNGTTLTASDDTSFMSATGPSLTFSAGALTDFDFQKTSLPAFNSSFLGFDDFDSMYGEWTSTTLTAVPVPAAAWLFGSGLLGLVGIARRKNA